LTQGKPRSIDAQIYVKLKEFDRSIKQPQFEQLVNDKQELEIPLRELMIRCSLCRSVMEIGHSNLNFGNMDKNERRTKRIVIRNHSEAPLLYRIRKSGSIASGDLILTDGRLGVVRGYGKREVEFEFEPSLPGLFQEKLTIENIQNPGNNQMVTVKANVRQPANFSIANVLLDFGPSLVNQANYLTQDILISNPSIKQTKVFEVRVEPQDLKFANCSGELWFSIPEEDGSHTDTEIKRPGSSRAKVMITKEIEEQIEQLEQKLKIAERKGRKDKVITISEQLSQLHSGKKPDDYAADRMLTDKVFSPPEPIFTPTLDPLGIERQNSSNEAPKSRPGSGNHAHRVKRTDCSIIFPVGPRCIRSVKVHFRPIRVAADTSGSGSQPLKNLLQSEEPHEICNIRLFVNEHKNLDVACF
jgi:hypothetical protein